MFAVPNLCTSSRNALGWNIHFGAARIFYTFDTRARTCIWRMSIRRWVDRCLFICICHSGVVRRYHDLSMLVEMCPPTDQRSVYKQMMGWSLSKKLCLRLWILQSFVETKIMLEQNPTITVSLNVVPLVPNQSAAVRLTGSSGWTMFCLTILWPTRRGTMTTVVGQAATSLLSGQTITWSPIRRSATGWWSVIWTFRRPAPLNSKHWSGDTSGWDGSLYLDCRQSSGCNWCPCDNCCPSSSLDCNHFVASHQAGCKRGPVDDGWRPANSSICNHSAGIRGLGDNISSWLEADVETPGCCCGCLCCCRIDCCTKDGTTAEIWTNNQGTAPCTLVVDIGGTRESPKGGCGRGGRNPPCRSYLTQTHEEWVQSPPWQITEGIQKKVVSKTKHT